MAYEWMRPMSALELEAEALDHDFSVMLDPYAAERAEAAQDARHEAWIIEFEAQEIAAGRLCGACHGYECPDGVVGACPTAAAIAALPPRPALAPDPDDLDSLPF